MRDVPIYSDEIRLGQLLKLAALVEHGGEAKAVIGEGLVAVNGETETRRGRPLRVGDEVTVHGETVRVAADS